MVGVSAFLSGLEQHESSGMTLGGIWMILMEEIHQGLEVTTDLSLLLRD